MSEKISKQLAEIDYVNSNAIRISSEVRKVFRYPAGMLQEGLNAVNNELGEKKMKTEKVRKESEVAQKYFSNLMNKGAMLKGNLEAIAL